MFDTLLNLTRLKYGNPELTWQSSSAVYDAALRKVHNYVEGRILEARVAGRIAAGLCRALCKVTGLNNLTDFMEGKSRYLHCYKV